MKRFLPAYCFTALCFLLLPPISFAAEKAPALTVRDTGAVLYSRQDVESAPIAKLAKGEALIPLMEAVGPTVWYLVETPQGVRGWVRASDVIASDQIKETFKERSGSTWTAQTSGGRTFTGTWSVEPAQAPDQAAGTWTLRSESGTTAIHGTWSAQKFSTGWSGTWRAAIEGRPEEITGSWTTDLVKARDARLVALFEAAARDAVRGIWSAGRNSGNWSIQAAR